MKILFENVSSCQQHAMFTVWIRKLITGTGTSGEFDFTKFTRHLHFESKIRPNIYPDIRYPASTEIAGYPVSGF
jgi:hypothetical protein